MNSTTIRNSTTIMNSTAIMKDTAIMNSTAILNSTAFMNDTAIMNSTAIMNGTTIILSRPVTNELISLEASSIILTTNFMYINPLVSVFGIVANVISIIIYSRHGFADSINVTFVALATSDLGGLIASLWYGVGLNPNFLRLVDYLYFPHEFLRLSAGLPRTLFSKVSCWITVYITFERCLCIVAPLKVRRIVTPRRTIACMLALYAAGFLVNFPHAYLGTMFFTWRPDPLRNRTSLGLGFSRDFPRVEVIGGWLNSLTILIPFGLLILSTVFLVVELQRKSKWRQSIAAPGGKGTAQFLKRDGVVFKVICTLAAVLIVCYLPQTLIFIAMSVFPEFSFIGSYNHMYGVVWSMAWVLETVNSSSTIFIYYTVSSKYRNTFRQLFSWVITGK